MENLNREGKIDEEVGIRLDRTRKIEIDGGNSGKHQQGTAATGNGGCGVAGQDGTEAQPAEVAQAGVEKLVAG